MLTLTEFMKLSEKERGQRYCELSDHDKFVVRVSIDGVPKAKAPREMATEEQRTADIKEAQEALGIDLSSLL